MEELVSRYREFFVERLFRVETAPRRDRPNGRSVSFADRCTATKKRAASADDFFVSSRPEAAKQAGSVRTK